MILALTPLPASAELTGWKTDIFAEVVELDPQTAAESSPPEYASCFVLPPTPPTVLFGYGFMFTGGLAYIGDILYGVGWTTGAADSPVFVYTVSANLSGCAEGTTVGTLPVGFVNLENLAYVPATGFLYSVDWDGPAHRGQLIRIDPATGVGTPVDPEVHLSRNLRAVGMTYDPTDDVLLAVTSGFGGTEPDARLPELIAIDYTTGVETCVGLTGTPPSTGMSPVLESLALDPSVSPARILAAGPDVRELSRATGLASAPIGSVDGVVWALAMRAPEEIGPDTDGDGVLDCVDGDAPPPANGEEMCDNCTHVPNEEQDDADENGIGDACQCGDVDGNGLTNTVDALMIARGEVPSADPNFGKCDVDGSGSCNTVDALKIARGEVSSAPEDQLCPIYQGL